MKKMVSCVPAIGDRSQRDARAPAPQAGQKDTRGLLAQYGDRLVCVSPHALADQIVPVRVAFGELALRQQVKQAGGTWNPERKVSELRYDRAVPLGLVDRIAPGAGSERGPSI